MFVSGGGGPESCLPLTFLPLLPTACRSSRGSALPTAPPPPPPRPPSFSGAHRAKGKVWEATCDTSLTRPASRSLFVPSQNARVGRGLVCARCQGCNSYTGRTDELWTPSSSEIVKSQAPPPGNTQENPGATLLPDRSVPQFTICSQRSIMCVISQSVCPGIISMNCK